MNVVVRKSLGPGILKHPQCLLAADRGIFDFSLLGQFKERLIWQRVPKKIGHPSGDRIVIERPRYTLLLVEKIGGTQHSAYACLQPRVDTSAQSELFLRMQKSLLQLGVGNRTAIQFLGKLFQNGLTRFKPRGRINIFTVGLVKGGFRRPRLIHGPCNGRFFNAEHSLETVTFD